MKYHSAKIFCTKKQFCTILTALLLPCFSQFTNANILSPQPTPHGWAEVKSDGIWRKCDVTMNLFMYAGKTTKKYECLETYKLLIQTGNVYWK